MATDTDQKPTTPVSGEEERNPFAWSSGPRPARVPPTGHEVFRPAFKGKDENKKKD